MDRLDKNWGGLKAPSTAAAGDSEDQQWLSGEPHWLHDTRENNSHWASLAPDIHSATSILDPTFPTHEWTDVMPPGLGGTRRASAQLLQYMASAAGVPPVGPHPMAYANPAWTMAGDAPAAAAGGRAHEGASGHMGAHTDGHAHSGWHSPALPPDTNASLSYHGAGASWSYSSRAAASSQRMTASTAQQMFGEKLVHKTTAGGQQEFGRTSSSSASEAGGADSGNDGAADRIADHFHWWVDAPSSGYPGDMPNG